MEFKDTPFWIWWKEYGKHVEAVAIIFLLISVWFIYDKNNKLSEEIKTNCGWGEDDYFCYCEKSEAIAIKNKAQTGDISFGGLNVTLDK